MTANKLPSVSLLIAINLSPYEFFYASLHSFQRHILESATHMRARTHTHTPSDHWPDAIPLDMYMCFAVLHVYCISLRIHLSHSCHRSSSIFRADSDQPNETKWKKKKTKLQRTKYTASYINMHKDGCHAINFDCVYLSFQLVVAVFCFFFVQLRSLLRRPHLSMH